MSRNSYLVNHNTKEVLMCSVERIESISMPKDGDWIAQFLVMSKVKDHPIIVVDENDMETLVDNKGYQVFTGWKWD